MHTKISLVSVVAKACIVSVVAIALVLTAPQNSVAQNLVNFDGRVMQNEVRVFFIYWTPPGVVLDTTIANGTGNFTTVLGRFPSDVSGSGYLNILTQYPGICSGAPCVLRNGAASVTLGGSFVDVTAYPGGRGTRANPLSDADIQNAVTRATTTNGWTADLNAIFFVITGVFTTGAPVEECAGSACTFNVFCGYHDHFNSGGVDIRYSYLSDASFNGGCSEGLSGSSANGQLSTDREVVLMSHELFEAVTDPEVNTWLDSAGNELGDKCNANTTASNAVAVTLNGSPYNVQTQFSNATASCVSTFGPSIKLTIGTGADDLRGNSSVAAALQGPASAAFGTFTLKAQPDAGWNNNTSHIGVGPFGAPSSALGRVALTLTSNNSLFQNNDNWIIQSVLIEVLNTTGVTQCSQSLGGNPLVQLGPNLPTASFDTPNCLPPPPAQEGIECRVFNDGYTDMTGPSGAVFINGVNQACIPDGTATGTCRKWFGRCSTVTSNASVVFNAFNDGYTSLVGSTDAIFINGQHQACIPDGTATGTCRKWFGRGQANDGRNVICTVFDDGASNRSITSDAVFVNGNGQSCIPDGTAQGRCSKWWGLCSAAAGTSPAPMDNASLTFSAPGSITVGSQATATVTATNTGTSTWGAGYSLNLLRTGRISLPLNSVTLGGTVGPGQSRTLTFQVQCSGQGLGGFSAQMSGTNTSFGNTVGQNILCQP